VAAAAEVFKATELMVRYKISMTRSRYGTLFFIIAAAGILVFKQQGNGCAGGPAIEYTAFEKRDIIFLARRGAFLCTTFSSFDIFQEVFYRQW